jgi:hypothetical protein
VICWEDLNDFNRIVYRCGVLCTYARQFWHPCAGYETGIMLPTPLETSAPSSLSLPSFYGGDKCPRHLGHEP